ncbi:MAG: fatty acyl-AMP ligase [Gemmatimonadales bacterium]
MGSPIFATLVDALRWRVHHQPDRLAYRFLPDGDAEEVCLTYGELHRRVSDSAAFLRSHRATGERVLLIFPPGLDFITAWFGCFSAGAAAVAVHPPHPARREQFTANLSAIVRDATPIVVLTTRKILDSLPADVRHVHDVPAPHWHAFEESKCALPEWDGADAGAQDLAFVQYTSGATSTPRGVMVSHGNLINNLEAIRASFRASADTESVSWLPPQHDLGLIGGILAPLYVGAPATLMSPAAFVQRPARWLRAISRFGATTSGSPNFGYDHCVRRISASQLEGVDLAGWTVAFNGAEPINASTLRAFADTFAVYGFKPTAFKACYGLAESTLLVSSTPTPGPPTVRRFRASDLGQRHVVLAERDDVAVREVPSCGSPAHQVLIVDPDSRIACRNGQVGEIWIAGPSVARGYWNHPVETRKTFDATPLHSSAGPFLRSGDLGFLLDGELFVTGRLKDLIIIDGQNHYPHDIERTVERAHSAIGVNDCAAFSVTRDEGEALVVMAVVTGRSRVPEEEVCRAIRTAVSRQHDLHVTDIFLLPTGHIPKTTSGKIRRNACRENYLARSLQTRSLP